MEWSPFPEFGPEYEITTAIEDGQQVVKVRRYNAAAGMWVTMTFPEAASPEHLERFKARLAEAVARQLLKTADSA